MIDHLKDGGTSMLIQRYEYNSNSAYATDYSTGETCPSSIPETLFEAMKTFSILIEDEIVFSSPIVAIADE